MSKRRPRTRHHANPLGFVREVALPDWGQTFLRPDQPLEVDVGCDKGEFLLGRAAQAPEVNLVGLEIRAPIVDMVADRIARQGLTNAAVVLCNANRSFEALFAPGALSAVYVHFPDPWFKARHRKRRLVTPAFVEAVAARLRPGGLFEVMTDFEPYAREVVPLVEGHGAFENPAGPGAPAAPEPGRVLTHREAWHESRGDPIHRYRWRRRPAAASAPAGLL
ncbi:MAG: tRNA (guanosine(46)-N7)-methyltransferase TrmB [Planctomycetes bacterium]|nr:tRNA (guanosine(46)-N7)-methyltransferase TrmB [Planctomycetota bacterium]